MILVTGATGFIGRSLMRALLRADIEARAYDGRINNPLILREQLVDVDTVIHLAGSEARGRNRLLQHVDLEGTERLIEESRRAGVQHLLTVSRIGADPASWHPLLQTKGAVERLIQKSGIPYTILRAPTLYGRNDRYLELLLGLAIWSWPFVWLPGGGQMVVQPLWVEDLVQCLLLALDHPRMQNKVIAVAGEERMSYRQMMQHMLAMTGHRRLPVLLPLLLLRPLSTLLFRWWYWPPVTPYLVDRFFVPELTDLDSVRHHFGFRPQRLTDTIAYLNRPGMQWRIFRR